MIASGNLRPGSRARGALVLGADYTALGIARSLGRRGIPVCVVKDRYSIAAHSRYARFTAELPMDGGDERQVEYLLELGERTGSFGWIAFPNGDATAALMARHHRLLSERFVLTVPPWEVLRWAYDKRLTYQLAAELGVDHMWTHCPSNAEELAAVDYRFPVILKPATKERSNRFTRAKAWRVDSREELETRYREACSLVPASEVLVQELIPGGGEHQFSYAALCQDGHPVAVLIARRARQYPIDFGYSSTYVETVDQPGVEEPAQRLLERLRYTGLVEVEFKRDPRDGRFKLLDINARAWSWHSIGRRAGVDFPYLCYRLMQGDRLPEVRAGAGVRWVRMLTDVLAAASGLRRGTVTPSSYIRSFGSPLEFAAFAWDDPLPAVLDIPLLLRRRWSRR